MTRHSAAVGRPWFVRKGSRYGCQLSPASPAGWLLTTLYILFAAGISWLLVGRGEPPAVIEWSAWALLLAASTFAFLLTAWRTSEVRQSDVCQANSQGGRSDAIRPILLSIAVAVLILGAALLGIEL
ncbi:MAG: hypothetical protein ACT4OE_05085 [Sphingosinicella sp.]